MSQDVAQFMAGLVTVFFVNFSIRSLLLAVVNNVFDSDVTAIFCKDFDHELVCLGLTKCLLIAQCKMSSWRRSVQFFENVKSYLVVFDLKVECIANALKEELAIFDV